MTILNRRGFVKTFLVTAAGAAPAYAALGPGELLRDRLTSDTAASVNLENGEQQLRFSPTGTQLSLQNFLRVGNEWKASTLPGNPIVMGPSFPLMTSSVRHEGN